MGGGVARFGWRCPTSSLIHSSTSSVRWELSPRSCASPFVSRLTTLGVAGLLTDGLGLAACLFPSPRLLGLLFVVALLQFFGGVMLLQSFWQLVHCFAQPFVAQAALALRRALVPAWFSVGRARPILPAGI